MPMELRHRFTFDIKGNAALGRTINGPLVAVVRQPTPVLRAPLSGGSVDSLQCTHELRSSSRVAGC